MNDKDKLPDFENYSDDEPVGIAVVERNLLPGPIESMLFERISQTLFHRLISTGDTNGLHFPKVVDHVLDSVLDRKQCMSLENELRHILQIVNEDDLKSAISILLGKIDEVKEGIDLALVISPP